jgi:hypothetical protein
MAPRRARSSNGTRATPRRKGFEGQLDDLAPLGPLPAMDDLVAVLDWYERLVFGEPPKISRRQVTASTPS